MFNNLITGKLLGLTLLTIVFALPQSLNAQSTLTEVHTILQTNCFGSDCHDAGTSKITLIGTESDVYNNIVNVNPENADALARGYKLVDPGYPHLSFLLKKINDGLDPDNDLDTTAQGRAMPKSAAPLGSPSLIPLAPEEIDLINQWIFHGAPQTGTVVDKQVIDDYHNIGGAPHKSPIPAPAPGEGFQIHYGSIFMEPNSEREFFIKKKLPQITEEMEITRLESYIDLESHHYIMYKFDSQADANAEPDGLQEVTGFGDAFINGTSMVAAWQNESNIELPSGTAYFWDAGVTLDLNLHVRNYDTSLILKAEVYTNVYLQPKKPATTEMISDLVLFSTIPMVGPTCTGFPIFCIPADSTEYTFEGDITSGELGLSSSDSMYVWLLSSHTHKYGTGYDIYLRVPGGPNGGKGQQVYNGNYDFTYTFDQGFYDFEDPAVRFFDLDTFVVKAGDGFVHNARYINYGTDDVAFGITTNDEMMLAFLQYTTARPIPVGVQEEGPNNTNTGFRVFPNPASGNTPISFIRENADMEQYVTLYDIMGKEMLVQKFPSGSNQLFLDKSHLSAGVYLYKAWSDNGVLSSGKLVMY